MPPKRPSSPVNGSNSNAKSPATAASRERRAGNGAPAAADNSADIDERGEFEDAWDDEFEEEDILSGEEDEDSDEDGMEGGNRVTGMEDGVDG